MIPRFRLSSLFAAAIAFAVACVISAPTRAQESAKSHPAEKPHAMSKTGKKLFGADDALHVHNVSNVHVSPDETRHRVHRHGTRVRDRRRYEFGDEISHAALGCTQRLMIGQVFEPTTRIIARYGSHSSPTANKVFPAQRGPPTGRKSRFFAPPKIKKMNDKFGSSASTAAKPKKSPRTRADSPP